MARRAIGSTRQVGVDALTVPRERGPWRGPGRGHRVNGSRAWHRHGSSQLRPRHRTSNRPRRRRRLGRRRSARRSPSRALHRLPRRYPSRRSRRRHRRRLASKLKAKKAKAKKSAAARASKRAKASASASASSSASGVGCGGNGVGRRHTGGPPAPRRPTAPSPPGRSRTACLSGCRSWWCSRWRARPAAPPGGGRRTGASVMTAPRLSRDLHPGAWWLWAMGLAAAATGTARLQDRSSP